MSVNNKVEFHNYMMSSVREGVLILDQTGVIAYADKDITTMLGHAPQALVGCQGDTIWPTLDMQASPTTHKTNLICQDGRPLPATITTTPITIQSSPHTLLAIRPTHALERLNNSLIHIQRLAGIGTLTSSVAHELTNPISIISATCSNLLLATEDNGLENKTQLLNYVRAIEQNAERCVRIMEVIRNYTIQNEPQVAVTDLNTIILDSLTLVQNQFNKEFNIRIQTDLAPNLKSIVCDHNRITQVMINLLTNACDAMRPTGGTIQIKSWAWPQATSETDNGKVKGKQRHYAFSISDTGHGIAPNLFERIFHPFFTTKPSSMGTGLGLFITQGIISQHNGRIWAENNQGGGATFTVVLPARQ